MFTDVHDACGGVSKWLISSLFLFSLSGAHSLMSNASGKCIQVGSNVLSEGVVPKFH